MLTIEVELKKSNINGLGIFAKHFIAKGTVIWVYIDNFDFHYSEKQFKSLPDVTKKFVLHYGYLEKVEEELRYVICGDDARFTNHSIDPNTHSIDGNITTSIKHIHAGEEITENYYKFDLLVKDKLKNHNRLKSLFNVQI